MLILPDSDETKCTPGVLDGGGFVVEVIAQQSIEPIGMAIRSLPIAMKLSELCTLRTL